MNFEVLGKFIVLSSDDSPGFRKELEAGKKIIAYKKYLRHFS